MPSFRRKRAVRVPSSIHLPPEPDRFAAIEPTRIERVWIVFACANLFLVGGVVFQRIELHFQTRALERAWPARLRMTRPREIGHHGLHSAVS